VHTQGGNPDEGFKEGMAALEEDRGGFNTPFALWSAARAALWSGGQTATAAERISTILAVTEDSRGAWIMNARDSLKAALAALEGRREEATTSYAAALETWNSMDLPFDHAVTVGDAMTILGPGALPVKEVDAAVTFLEEIGAEPLLKRITKVLADKSLAPAESVG
jgi:hypothetical protein